MPLQTRALAFIALLALSCARTEDNDPEECSTSDDCDDGVDCTFDACEAGECDHRAEDALCGDGESCDLEAGCVGGGCGRDEECDDGIDCTLDLCESSGTCTTRTMDELCPEGQRCAEGEGCVEAGCGGDGECVDEWPCTIDICGDDGACLHLPDDSVCAEGETCREDSGCQVIDCEIDEDCQDDSFCNGRETCHPEFGCRPAAEPEDCDDNDECTLEHCDTETDQCVYEINTEIPECDTFDPTRDYNGCFDITPPPTQRCACLFTCQVNYEVSEVCFSIIGSVLTMNTGTRSPMELTQTPAPIDENLNGEYEISGGCTETYTLSGTFTGSSRFSGTWTSVFTPSSAGACGGCPNITVPVEGVRRTGP